MHKGVPPRVWLHQTPQPDSAVGRAQNAHWRPAADGTVFHAQDLQIRLRRRRHRMDGFFHLLRDEQDLRCRHGPFTNESSTRMFQHGVWAHGRVKRVGQCCGVDEHSRMVCGAASHAEAVRGGPPVAPSLWWPCYSQGAPKPPRSPPCPVPARAAAGPSPGPGGSAPSTAPRARSCSGLCSAAQGRINVTAVRVLTHLVAGTCLHVRHSHQLEG